MKIVLTAMDGDLTDAWTMHCGDLSEVSVHRGSILDVACDAVVSPANSYGFMDGGIDAVYTHHFGRVVQDRVRSLILNLHHGELLVGAAEIVDTDDAAIPFLIAAPTMRVPMILGPDTIAPYLAARAVLLLVRHGIFAAGPHAGAPIADRVHTLAFPGLGTGVGRVDPDLCARQVRAAIEDHRDGANRLPTTWAEASETHQRLYTDRPKRLQ